MAGLNRFSRGTSILLAASAVAVLAAILVAVVVLPGRTISGQVIDGDGGGPVFGAVVKVGEQEYPVGENGLFSIGGLGFGATVLAEAPGYLPSSARVTFDGNLRLPLSPRVLEGMIVDGSTGEPLVGVPVSAGSLASRSDEQGRFRLERVELGTELAVAVDGFQPLAVTPDGRSTVRLSMVPNALVVRAVNQYTGEPLEGAEVVNGSASARTNAQGQAELKYLPEGARVQVRLEGFAPAEIGFSGQENAEAQLRPNVISGLVRGSDGNPLRGASVSDGTSTVTTDEAGAFKLTDVPENVGLTVSAVGYERIKVDVDRQATLEVTLKPFAARGLYLTYYGVGSDELREGVLRLADTTEVNAVVIDIKGDRGWLVYRSSVPMVAEIGAQQEIMIDNPRQFLTDLRARGVYSIARIVAFKDNPLAQARPDLAVINAGTGSPWVDMEGLRWTDATRQEVWDYNIALAVEAIELGFDEIQFDYVRFPTDAGEGNPLDSVSFSQANTMENRTAAIGGFLERASKAIRAKGGLVSADIFGYVVWRDDDMGIGQRLEELARHLDYVSPMVYPNLFWHGIVVDGRGLYTDQRAGLYPYEIVYESMKIAASRIGPGKLRPWLQYYDDYITGKPYTAEDVRLQKQAAYDNGITGWLFWDPTNRFGKGGFEPE